MRGSAFINPFAPLVIQEGVDVFNEYIQTISRDKLPAPNLLDNCSFLVGQRLTKEVLEEDYSVATIVATFHYMKALVEDAESIVDKNTTLKIPKETS